jgi:hypothetical protein
MHPDVDWPNAIDGLRLSGHEPVRPYWERQFETINPQVEPKGLSEEEAVSSSISTR